MTNPSHYAGFPRYTGPEPGQRKLRKEVDRSWEQYANCLGMDPDLFFPARGDMQAGREAKAVCRQCSAQAQCLEANLHERDGVWGGTSERDRVRIRRARRNGAA